jgi:hypothetical protein
MHKPFLAVAVALVLPATAAAADHTATLDQTAKTFKWDSTAGPGTFELQGCGATTGCDTTLLHVTDPGTLVASITADPTLTDANLRIALSNAAGDEVAVAAEATGLIADEKLAVPVEDAGYYLVTITDETGFGAVHGTAELLGDGDEYSVAAPDKRAALDAAHPTYSWDGIAGNGVVFDCGEVAPAVQPCDDILIHLTEPGDLSAAMSDASATTVLDYMTIYQSDKAGTKNDDAVLAQGIGATNPNPAAGAGDLEPGYYLIEIGWLAAVNGTYKGTATFTPRLPEDQ